MKNNPTPASELQSRIRRTQSGASTTDVVVTSYADSNSDVFPALLKLHVTKGARIADVTYGKGVFWGNVDMAEYEVLPSDIKTGVDARALPYDCGSLDAVVFDPPYMEGLYRRDENHLAGGGNFAAFRDFYSNGKATDQKLLKYHDLVIDMYMSVACEIHRVLKADGIFIVKCQDEVSANRQKLTHIEIVYGYEQLGFYCKDVFVVTRNNKPGISRLLKQVHARKNHSYFLVFVKPANGKLPYSNFRSLLKEYVPNKVKSRLQKEQVGQIASPKVSSKSSGKSKVQPSSRGK